MKLIFIRHADPDYDLDSLTPTGWREAEALAEHLSSMEVAEYFVSPLGRARATASPTMQRIGAEATVLPWLTEFTHRTPSKPSYPLSSEVPWDWRPLEWTVRPRFFDREQWAGEAEMEESNIGHHYRTVCHAFDAFLAERGYERSGRMYRTLLGHTETYVFFCHLGSMGILLSHLLNISPMIMWHSFAPAPSSITTVVTEERQKGHVSMRLLSFGATPHLDTSGIEPSFAARFCETYEMVDQRH